MPRLPVFKSIALQDIEQSDGFNLHPFLPPEPPASLCASISRLGILHPPILKRQGQDNYLLLCGRYRLGALRLLVPPAKSTTCLVLADEAGPGVTFAHVVEDQLIGSGLSPMEIAYALHYGIQHLAPEETAQAFRPLLGEKVQDHVIRKKLSLLQLETATQQSVHEGRINEKLAYELLQLETGDRMTLHGVFLDLGLGGGKQKRLLTLCRDLAFSQGVSISALLREGDCATILDHAEINSPQKAATLLTFLQRKLFPESTAAEEAFSRQVKRMDLPGSCTISHSPAFERDEVSVSLQFSDLSEMEKRLPEIRRMMKE